MIELRAPSWDFSAPEPPLSRLTAPAPRAGFAPPAGARDGFTVTATVLSGDPGTAKTILEIPGVLRVRLRQHDPHDRERQNYPAHKMPDGSVPVLEASVALHSVEHPDWSDMTIGIPLAMLGDPGGEHAVVLHFVGPHWGMYVDGELLDNDFPFGYPRWREPSQWSMDTEHVREASIHLPALRPLAAGSGPRPGAPTGIQYWTPPGHNSWVGDVATISYGGRYHLFYLYDRRHHRSKFGCGAHYFEHLSTADFATWTEHEAATPLQEQWECIGTGVPFVLDGKLCVSYGLHTTRVYPREQTTLPAQWQYLERHGRTACFRRGEAQGVPAGSTYSTCVDGISRFRRSDVFFHPCENPTVYTDPDGRLRLIANAGAKGIWESESVDGGWRCISPGFPPGGDCTFHFRWGRFDYIIGGFTGLWSKPADAPLAAYDDLVRKGLDIYDGSCVPSVAEIPGGRFVMAAWIPVRGWGGPLVMRELLQLDRGRLGTRWMDEATPEAGEPATVTPSVVGTADVSTRHRAFQLVFTVEGAAPGKGRIGVSLLPGSGEQGACELQIRLDALRAQFGPGSRSGFAPQQKSLREGGAPHDAGNYAIENLIAADRAFTVRVIVKGSDKLGGTLVDAEIAGRRTMISYRPDLMVERLVLRTEEATLRDVRLAPLREA